VGYQNFAILIIMIIIILNVIIISPHGIAMPKGFLFYCCGFFFLSSFFLSFRHLISEIAELISTKLGHL